MQYMFWKYLVYKSNTSPSTPHSGEIRMSQKNTWFHCEMMPDQEKGFRPIPYILNDRYFSYKSLISIENQLRHHYNIIPLLWQLGPEDP